MALSPDNIPRFVQFLEEVDQYISARYKTLTCDNICAIYFQFFQDMKALKGNSNGFTGLSEYLVFRSVYHLLGGSFEQVKLTNDLYVFDSKRDKGLRISQSTRVDSRGRRLYPDIAVSHARNLLAVCQIKIYLTNGSKTIQAELEKLDYLKKCYADLNALLLVFGTVPAKGKIAAYLKTETSKRPWFRYYSLRGDGRVLVDVMKEGLGLSRLEPKVTT